MTLSLAPTYDKKLDSEKVAALAGDHQGRAAKRALILEVGRCGQVISDEITHALDVPLACGFEKTLAILLGNLRS